MKHLHLIGLLVCGALFVSCEETGTAGNSPRAGKYGESERAMAQRQAQQPQHAEMDEGQQNLWNAQENILRRDGSTTTRY